jgi:hypothetical protein
MQVITAYASFPVEAGSAPDAAINQMNVFAGAFYSADVSGSNLTSETFFDVRFVSPGSNESAVALNWQKGPRCDTRRTCW